MNVERVKTLDEAKTRVDDFVDTAGVSVVRFAVRFLGVSAEGQVLVERRYAERANIKLREFAPYASHVLKINLFFYVAMASHLIARERPSNFVDIAYLYYLPFCQAFTSSDKLHARIVPLFCEQGQQFVDGRDLKNALREINEFYLRHVEEIEEVGIMRFARRPPEHLDDAVTRLWDRFMPRWREAATVPEEEKKEASERRMTPERLIDVMEKSTPIESTVESEYVMITRKTPIRKGRWRLMPPEVEQR